MPKETTLTLKGKSGNTYDFDVYPWRTNFNAVGAVYIVLKILSNGEYDLIYIGQTGDLSSRFGDHHNQSCFDRHGKTHIGIHRESSEKQRFAIESDLIANYTTNCNG